jgi:hypothetical protein
MLVRCQDRQGLTQTRRLANWFQAVSSIRGAFALRGCASADPRPAAQMRPSMARLIMGEFPDVRARGTSQPGWPRRDAMPFP